MALNNVELPDKVFVIGTPHNERHVTLHNGVWDGSNLFTYIWTTKSALDSWLSEHPSDVDYFELNIYGILGCLLFKRAIKYVLVDPPSEFSYHSDGQFFLRSHEVEKRIDMHSTIQLLDALERNLRRSGVPKDKLEAVRAQAQSDPQLAPFDALIQFEPFRESESVLARCSGTVVRQMGLEETVWKVLGCAVKKSLVNPFRAIWDAHSELTYNEMQNYWTAAYSVALDRSIADLKASGEFRLVFDYCLANLLDRDGLASLVEPLTAMASERNEWTLRRIAERIYDSILDVQRRGFHCMVYHPEIWKIILVWFQLYPEPACARCGETAWQYESVSPSGKAATWRCGYCSRTTIVKEDDLKRRTAAANREPIPKDVQREVWQRDGGRCVVCGSQKLLEFDHIIAHSKGGSNTARNIQLLCQNCNRKKSSKPPGEG